MVKTYRRGDARDQRSIVTPMATVGIMGGGTFSEFMLATKSGKTPSFDAPGTLTQPSRPPPNGCMRHWGRRNDDRKPTDINNCKGHNSH